VTSKHSNRVRVIKVTVYIPCHNYARFLTQAIESVVQQTLRSWELFVINDGSSDNTAEIAKSFAARDARIRYVENPEPVGLRRCANMALKMAKGEYFVRLDADDYFDESALLVLSQYLDTSDEHSLVYPNWTYVAEDGTYLGIERRKKIGKEVECLDIPPHGACTLVRRRVLKAIGGYDPSHDAQDGHELWLKILHRFKAANVTTPLFFYRQHGKSMSNDNQRLLSSRREIKRSIANASTGPIAPRSVAVIPAKNTYDHLPNIDLHPIAGKALIDYTIESALESQAFEVVYVFTDDPNVVKHCSKYANVLAELRPAEYSSSQRTLAEVLAAAIGWLEERHDVFPDIVTLLSVHTPLKRSVHIREAIDTLMLYDVNSVISTYEDLDLHFVHAKNGMQPLNPGMINQLRYEREALYVGNGAIHVIWRDFISPNSLFEGRIGHIVMPRHLSYYIKSPEDLSVVSSILERGISQEHE